jgi:hypothetical protein
VDTWNNLCRKMFCLSVSAGLSFYAIQLLDTTVSSLEGVWGRGAYATFQKFDSLPNKYEQKLLHTLSSFQSVRLSYQQSWPDVQPLFTKSVHVNKLCQHGCTLCPENIIPGKMNTRSNFVALSLESFLFWWMVGLHILPLCIVFCFLIF